MNQRANPKAILFDMGGTLEKIIPNREKMMEGSEKILDLLKDADVLKGALRTEDLEAKVRKGLREYREWSAKNNHVELKPKPIWLEWILHEPVFEPGLFDEQLAEKLSFLWETDCFHRVLRSEAIPVIEWLKTEGYALAIVSNSISDMQVHHSLERYGLTPYFEVVEISCTAGYRKPSPVMLHNAAKQLGIDPRACVYVGDTYTRDVLAARAAGYGSVLWLQTPEGLRHEEYGKYSIADQAEMACTFERVIVTLNDVVSFLDDYTTNIKIV